MPDRMRDFAMQDDMRKEAGEALRAAGIFATPDVPVLDKVVRAVLQEVAYDVLDAARERDRCGKSDECVAEAVVLRYLAVWLTGEEAVDV